MIALTSSLFIFLSVTILTLATLPTFTTEDGSDYQPFAICEAVATLWFSLEFLVRLLASPDKKRKILEYECLVEEKNKFKGLRRGKY